MWLDCLVDDVGADVYEGLARLQSANKKRYIAFLQELIEYSDAEIARYRHPEIKGAAQCA